MVDLVSSLGFRVNGTVGMAKIGSETLGRDRGTSSKYDRDATESPIVQGLEMTQTTWVPCNTISRYGVQVL